MSSRAGKGDGDAEIPFGLLDNSGARPAVLRGVGDREIPSPRISAVEKRPKELPQTIRSINAFPVSTSQEARRSRFRGYSLGASSVVGQRFGLCSHVEIHQAKRSHAQIIASN